ncbi:hypothetical protein NDU88_000942 [Pleurodeles waltl]|uniref:Uncharacterized protein n=1 Tax=Pleurodeles waltl TaxID=8319 RepID=A0AAV7USP2_PLEWA|nr:hypothetical protein NDU88_000942 [Pleurodeles waltl]
MLFRYTRLLSDRATAIKHISFAKGDFPRDFKRSYLKGRERIIYNEYVRTSVSGLEVVCRHERSSLHQRGRRTKELDTAGIEGSIQGNPKGSGKKSGVTHLGYGTGWLERVRNLGLVPCFSARILSIELFHKHLCN